jgi:hypothetical protein
LNHNLPRFGCLLGAFSPSRRQMRSTRLWLTSQPSALSIAVIGAATGGFLGSNIGSGKGQLAATAAGTLIGAMIGASMAQASEYPVYGSNYPVAYPEPQPVYVIQEPQPIYVVQQPPRRVVVKREVVVKHVYTPAPKRVKVIKKRDNDRFDRNHRRQGWGYYN